MKPRFQQEETEITEKWFCASLFPLLLSCSNPLVL